MAVFRSDYRVEPPAPDAPDSFRSLPEVFSVAVAARAAQCAVYDIRRRWTWQQWRRHSWALGAGLQGLGVTVGDVVAVRLPNSWEFLLAHVAIADLGAVMLPLHQALGDREARALVERVRARVLVAPAEALGIGSATAPPASVEHLLVVGDGADDGEDSVSRVGRSSFGALVRDHVGARPEPVAVTPDMPFVLLPSSGTTSERPKICLHSHGGLMSNAAAVARDGAAGAGTLLVSASPFTHLFGLLSVHLSLVTGARQALLPAWDADALRALAGSAGHTALFAVPAQLRDLVQRTRAEQPTGGLLLREVRTGGAAVPGDLVSDLKRLLGAEIVVQWGMSELGAGMYTRPGDPPEAAVRGIGRPVTGGRARVVASDGTPCGDGETGELQFRGPHLFRGYLDDPAATSAAFTRDGWLRTGDRAARNTDGTFAYRGREAEVINVGGVKFTASEVESLLGGLHQFEALAVGARPDPRLGEVPCLVAALRPGAVIGLDEVWAHLEHKGVAEYKWPLDLLIVDEVPLTPTGKVARMALAALLAGPEAVPARGPEDSAWAAGLASLTAGERLRRTLALVEDTAHEVADHRTERSGHEWASFRDLGIGSLASVRMALRLAAATGLPVTTTAVFDHPTPQAMAAHLLALAADASGTAPGTGTAHARASASGTTRGAPTGPLRTGDAPPRPDDPVVITGIGCRFPGGVRTPDELWRLIVNGEETAAGFPEDRGWDLAALHHFDPAHPGATPAQYGSFLAGAADFDARFFGISPREALAMDPQQRLLLETGWEALERAGMDPTSLRASATGVFIGMMASDYGPRVTESPGSFDGRLLTGNAAGVASGRIAYTLGLTGPALTVDTACSSSLVALHLARQALLRGECRLALAGGVTVMSTPGSFVDFGRQGALSPDGRSKAFADTANGTGWGEGAGVLVLERLSDAKAGGHPILAVIAGSAVNQDGAGNGLTAPSGPAQRQVIRQALADAGLTAADIDLVEAHGTGTPLGDRIEAEALLAAYGHGRPERHPLRLGSVKPNIGHTQAAAGAAGVIKALLAMRHDTLPRTLHADRPTPHVDWGQGAVRLLRESLPWPRGPRIRRAAVSAFGISGTNAHLILHEPPHPTSSSATSPSAASQSAGGRELPWVLSARSLPALRTAAAELAQAPAAADDSAAPAVAYRLATGRPLFGHRAVIVSQSPQELRAGLRAVADGQWSPHVLTGTARPRTRTVFVFPGQGTQWPGMATDLLSASPVFADALQACDQVLAPHVGWSVLDVLHGTPGVPRLTRDDVAQPALFAVMVSLAELWRSYGVLPDAVIGHSQGELAAAYVAGALGLADAATAVARRAAAVRTTVGAGAMATVALSRDDTTARLSALPRRHAASLTVAAVNAPRSTVVAGAAEAVGQLVADLTADGIRAKAVPVGYASHSAAVEPVRRPLLSALAGLHPRPSRIPFYSTVDGARRDTTTLTAEYWYRNLRRPVEFAAATRAALDDGFTHFIEMSPHPVLTDAVLETAESAGVPIAATGTLRRGEGGPGRFLLSTAEAFVQGVPVDWRAALPHPAPGSVDLPTYPFRRERYWLTPAVRDAAPDAAGPALGPASAAAPGTVTAPGPDLTDPAVDSEAAALALVRSLAADVLGYPAGEGPTADETFLAAGMTSLTAAQLRTRLSHRLGVDLPSTAVFDHPTPAALGGHLWHLLTGRNHAAEGELPDGLEALYERAVASGRADIALGLIGDASVLRDTFDTASHTSHVGQPVPLGEGVGGPGKGDSTGDGTSFLLCLPSVLPASGPHEYAALARCLSGSHTVFALPQPGFRTGESLPRDIDALLYTHAAAVARLGPASSIVLCGHSSGGLIARALAARLEALGRPADGLILLDTFLDDDAFHAELLPRFLIMATARQRTLGTTRVGITRLTAAGCYLRLLAEQPAGQPANPGTTPTLLVRARRPLPGTSAAEPRPRRQPAHSVADADANHFTMLDAPQAAAVAAAVEKWLAAR
ncbi:acyltransferase domain-containing protein [Streptomyces sp. NPDC005355]|uniref:type I polyketide synthase n=1 Tax=Streptomyces sp. NPDC005355 TaxID=3157038 RepID=UPI0033BB5AB8